MGALLNESWYSSTCHNKNKITKSSSSSSLPSAPFENGDEDKIKSYCCHCGRGSGGSCSNKCKSGCSSSSNCCNNAHIINTVNKANDDIVNNNNSFIKMAHYWWSPRSGCNSSGGSGEGRSDCCSNDKPSSSSHYHLARKKKCHSFLRRRRPRHEDDDNFLILTFLKRTTRTSLKNVNTLASSLTCSSFVIKCLILVNLLCHAATTVGADLSTDDPCQQRPPPCPLNAHLVPESLVSSNNSTFRIHCDEGYELFGSNEVSCEKAKWKHGYCATNIAVNRPTNQSSTASTAQHGKNSSHLANDGLTDSCSSTQKEVNPFWIVDLLQIHQITGLKISNGGKQSGDSENSVDLEVRVGNNPVGLKNPLCAWQPGANLNTEEKYLECARPLSGRYVSVQIIGEGALRMCEVQVYAIDGVPKARCAPEVKAANDVHTFNGTCYEFATTSGQTFSGARSQCLARTGDLPTEHQLKPNSPTLNFVTTILDRLKPTLKRPLIWIGVERDPGFTSRSWRWIDSGYVVKKPMWGKDQPNNYNGEQNCAVLDGQREWTWNDVGCGLDYFHWICVFPPNSCGSPDRQAGTEITNESQAGSYRVGATLIHKCSAAGHFMFSGSKIRVCQRNGMWNGTAPQCKYINCGVEPLHEQIKDGKIILPTNNETYYGAEIQYECNDGYQIARGPKIRSCGNDAKWTGKTPQCLMSNCAPPTEIVNGTFVSTGTTEGSTATYHCNSGHILIGSATLRCQLGGTYDAPPPSCQYVTCGDLPGMEHGEFRLVNSTAGAGNIAELGSLAVAHCTDNYELTDPDFDRIICSEQGTWRSLESPEGNARSRLPSWESLIKCQLIVCDEPEVPHGSFVTGYDFTVGSEIQYHCEEGHKMIGGHEIRRCTNIGEWSGTPPECKYIDCGRAQTIPFGQVSYFSGKTHLGSVVHYSCAPNYRLNGPANRTCNVNGLWSGGTPKCEEIRCLYPRIPPAAVATVSKNDRFNAQTLLTSESASANTTTFRVGSILKYRCERGYKLQGDTLRSCEEGGHWSVINDPECIFVDCKSPPGFINGEIKLTSNATYFGSTAIYECWNGFKLIGNARRTCLENGSWSGYDPHCREIQCDAPEPTNATIDVTSFHIGGYVKYSCGKGQFLVGEGSRRCSDHGIWAGQVPHCKYTMCPPAPDSPNTRKFLVNDTTIFSSIVEYHCIPNFKHIPGSQTILTCTEFGTWSPPTPPTCLSPDESPEIFKRVEPPQESSSSIVGIVIGIIIGLFAIIAIVILLLWIVKRSRQPQKHNQDHPSRAETLKAEPMVVFPNHHPIHHQIPHTMHSHSGSSMSSGGSGGSSLTPPHPQHQNYYDNPTIDPIYENLDDYGVTSSAASVVTINGVAVS